MRVSIFGMLVRVLTVCVCSGRVLFGLVVLPMRVMVGSLQVVMGSCMVVSRRHHVMLRGRMLVLLWHDASS
jgi:hypothetical protein